VELRFEDGFEELSQHFLGDTVSHAGNAEWTHGCILATRDSFGNPRAPIRFWMIPAALFHQAHEFCEMDSQIFLKALDGDAIDSGCAFVTLDALEGFSHEVGGNPSGERMMFAFGSRSHRTLGWEESGSPRGHGQAASLEVAPYLREGEGCPVQDTLARV